jgi:hypothetical protein
LSLICLTMFSRPHIRKGDITTWHAGDITT